MLVLLLLPNTLIKGKVVQAGLLCSGRRHEVLMTFLGSLRNPKQMFSTFKFTDTHFLFRFSVPQILFTIVNSKLLDCTNLMFAHNHHSFSFVSVQHLAGTPAVMHKVLHLVGVSLLSERGTV